MGRSKRHVSRIPGRKNAKKRGGKVMEGFIIGLFIGATAGTIVMCAMAAASDEDRRREHAEELERLEMYYIDKYTKWEEVEKTRDEESERQEDGKEV